MMRFQKDVKINNKNRKGRKSKMTNSKRNKLLFCILTAVTMLLGLLSVAYATIDCNASTITTINKLTAINATFNVSNEWATVNVAFELRDTSNHINSSYSLIGNVSNTSNLRHANLTFGDNIVFPDSDNADLRVTCYGEGGDLNVSVSSAVTGINIDRTNPAVNGITNIGSNLASNLQTISFGFINASRWRFFHNNLVIQTTTVTSNLVNVSGSQQIQLRDSGSYYVEVFDGTNITNSATISYVMAGGLIKSSVSKQAEVKKVIEQKKAEKQQKSNKNVLLVGAFIVILIVVGILILTPKIKRKRR